MACTAMPIIGSNNQCPILLFLLMKIYYVKTKTLFSVETYYLYKLYTQYTSNLYNTNDKSNQILLPKAFLKNCLKWNFEYGKK